MKRAGTTSNIYRSLVLYCEILGTSLYVQIIFLSNLPQHLMQPFLDPNTTTNDILIKTGQMAKEIFLFESVEDRRQLSTKDIPHIHLMSHQLQQA